MVAGIGKVNPSTGPGSHSRGFAHKTVIITGITDDGRITCKDNFGKEVMVNASVQRAKGFPPEVGERWMIDRTLGGWTLAACLSVPATPPLMRVVSFATTTGYHPDDLTTPNFVFQWEPGISSVYGDPSATWCHVDPDDPTRILILPGSTSPRLISVVAAWSATTFTEPPAGSHVEWNVVEGDLLLTDMERTENWVGPETWGITSPLWTVRQSVATTYPVTTGSAFGLSVWTNAPGAYGSGNVRICDLGPVGPPPS